MSDSIIDFLDPINLAEISLDAGYREGQIGMAIKIYSNEFPDLDEAQIILVGCTEQRGGALLHQSGAPNAIRSEFYNLYYWHHDIKLADIGNVKIGKTNQDSYAALKIVLHELIRSGKTVVILGGTHDLTLGQYYAFVDDKKLMDAVGI